jgi:Outer membrane protein beta-barrel domain
MRRSCAVVVLLFLAAVPHAAAQSLQVSGHVATAQWSEFDGGDFGVGGRLTWKPSSFIGVDAEATWYPSDFQPDGAAFSRQRVEGMLGLTFGPRLDRVRPFAKASAGFLKVSPTSGGFACIAIYPPPLACRLAGGDTLPVFEIGGGIEVDAASRIFFRADLTERILRYPGPVFRGSGLDNLVDEDFFGGALKLLVGAGLRF